MPTTRFQTHSPQHRSWRAPRGRGHRRLGRALIPPTLPIPGHAGFHYDTAHLSPVSAERAIEGIEADFMFHSLTSMTDGQDRYIAFQLYIPVAVRVYDPVTQRPQQNRVTCNCVDYQSTQSACAHLYWLFTRLNGVLREDQQENQQETSSQDSTQIEVMSGLSALYPLIDQRRDSLPKDLKDKLESDSDDSMTEDNIHDNIMDNEPADIYEPSSSSAQIPRHGNNNGF